MAELCHLEMLESVVCVCSKTSYVLQHHWFGGGSLLCWGKYPWGASPSRARGTGIVRGQDSVQPRVTGVCQHFLGNDSIDVMNCPSLLPWAESNQDPESFIHQHLGRREAFLFSHVTSELQTGRCVIQPPAGHVFTCSSMINQHRPTQFCLLWACAQHVYTCPGSACVCVFMCWLFHPSDTEVFRECAT